MSIELTNETDAAVGKYTLKLDTGAIVGSKAGVRKSNMAVPNTFGVLIIPDVEGLVDGKDDPLELNIKNSENKLLRLNFLHGSLRVFVDNKWVELSNHIKAYPRIHGPEWWVEAKKVDGDKSNISVYVGTQKKGEVTGALPHANVKTTADVEIFQFSNSLPNRVSRVSIIEIGETQRAQDMTLISKPRQSSSQPSEGCISIAVEDVSVALLPNENLIASLSSNDGVSWNNISLKDYGIFGFGELGTKKGIHLLAGCAEFKEIDSGTKVRYQINTSGGDFFVIQNVTAYWK